MAVTGKPVKGMRGVLAPPGSSARVGVGRPSDVSDRCRATHDVPYTLRCILGAEHVYLGMPEAASRRHVDKEGGVWG